MIFKPMIDGSEIDHTSIPREIELFGRTIRTIDDSEKLNLTGSYGEARYGVNHIALSDKVKDRETDPEEIKLTYLHEMLHFILNFTGFEKAIQENEKIDLEQFTELVSSGIYQYEKSAKY